VWDLGLLIYNTLVLGEENIVVGPSSLREQTFSKLGVELFIAFETSVQIEVLHF
jgi:hypothetical protein